MLVLICRFQFMGLWVTIDETLSIGPIYGQLYICPIRRSLFVGADQWVGSCGSRSVCPYTLVPSVGPYQWIPLYGSPLVVISMGTDLLSYLWFLCGVLCVPICESLIIEVPIFSFQCVSLYASICVQMFFIHACSMHVTTRRSRYAHLMLLVGLWLHVDTFVCLNQYLYTISLW